MFSLTLHSAYILLVKEILVRILLRLSGVFMKRERIRVISVLQNIIHLFNVLV